MSSDDKMVFEGVIIETARDIFTVVVSADHSIRATISGKLRTSGIRLLVGDRVSVECGLYDLTKGRVIFRHKA